MIKVGESLQVKAAQAVALDHARDYLRKQYLSANPSAITIASTIKGYVDTQPQLLAMLTVEIAAKRQAYGWPALDIGTSLGANRYLEAVKSIIVLLS